MPIVAHSSLPAFDRLRLSGQEVLDLDRANHQDIRELHIGLLNMMPDAALEATERQFFRLVGACNRIAQFYVYPFTVEGIERGPAALAYMEKYYEDFGRLKQNGLDALIITGANITRARLVDEPFWEPMAEVVEWGNQHVTSMLCSCLASHAVFKRDYDIDRTHLGDKCWGVFSHRVVDQSHPLMSNINTRFDSPHSRFNDVPRQQLEAAGLRVLVESPEAGVLLAVSADGIRRVYFQGHPEYDVSSLIKEYKREVFRYLRDERPDYPPYPENYVHEAAREVLEVYKREAVGAKEAGKAATVREFPEDLVLPHLDNTWTDTGKAIFNNWLGLVYQLTDRDRAQPFMPGVDPADPLHLRTA